MPTNKPRVQVTLEPLTHAVIERLAALQGRTRGAVIADMLDAVSPALTRTVALLEAAQDAPAQVREGMRRAVEGAHLEIANLAGDASKQLDAFLDQIGSDEPLDPHVVTRGSGTQSQTAKVKPKKASNRSKPADSANG